MLNCNLSYSPYPVHDQMTITSTARAREMMVNMDNSTGEDTITRAENTTVVGWNDHKIVLGNDSRLYTTQVGPCVGVLARVFDPDSKENVAFGLAHCWTNADDATSMITDLINRGYKGRIQLYLAGGYPDYPLSLTIQKTILCFIKALPENTISSLENNLNIGCKATCGKRWLLTVGLKELGFDVNGNPYLIVDANYG